jgi:hypothetical protein
MWVFLFLSTETALLSLNLLGSGSHGYPTKPSLRPSYC